MILRVMVLTIIGNPAYANGRFNQALSFDGIDDYVNIGSPGALNIQGELSMSTWINPTIPTTGESLLMNGSFKYGLTYYIDGNIWFYIGQGGNNVNTSVSPNIWHHVVATWDGTTNPNGMKLYVDGELRAQKASNVNSTGATGPVYIARTGNLQPRTL
jgi:hypothetical protein